MQNETAYIAQVTTIAKAAELTGISSYTLRSWAREGRFASAWAGRKLLVNIDSLARYLDSAGLNDERGNQDALQIS